MREFTTRIVLFVFFAGMSVGAHAGMVFEETFTNNTRGWPENANWQVTNGVYKFTSPVDFYAQNKTYIPFGLVSTNDFAGATYTVSYDFRFLGPWVGFNAGLSWEDNTGNQNWSANSLENTQVTMRSFTSAGFQTLTYQDYPSLVVGQWYHIDITVVWDYVTIYVDDIKMIEGYLDTYAMDKLGFSVWRGNAEFDNVAVRSQLAVQTPLEISTGVRLCWNSVRNQRYQIYYAFKNNPDTWFKLGKAITGDGDEMCASDSLKGPRKIYRLDID